MASLSRLQPITEHPPRPLLERFIPVCIQTREVFCARSSSHDALTRITRDENPRQRGRFHDPQLPIGKWSRWPYYHAPRCPTFYFFDRHDFDACVDSSGLRIPLDQMQNYWMVNGVGVEKWLEPAFAKLPRYLPSRGTLPIISGDEPLVLYTTCGASRTLNLLSNTVALCNVQSELCRPSSPVRQFSADSQAHVLAALGKQPVFFSTADEMFDMLDTHTPMSDDLAQVLRGLLEEPEPAPATSGFLSKLKPNLFY